MSTTKKPPQAMPATRAVELASSTTLDPSPAESPPSESLRHDILWGAQAIADEIGRDLRPTFYLLQKGLIPASKVGDVWVTTRSSLRRHFEGKAVAS